MQQLQQQEPEQSCVPQQQYGFAPQQQQMPAFNQMYSQAPAPSYGGYGGYHSHVSILSPQIIRINFGEFRD